MTKISMNEDILNALEGKLSSENKRIFYREWLPGTDFFKQKEAYKVLHNAMLTGHIVSTNENVNYTQQAYRAYLTSLAYSRRIYDLQQPTNPVKRALNGIIIGCIYLKFLIVLSPPPQPLHKILNCNKTDDIPKKIEEMQKFSFTVDDADIESLGQAEVDTETNEASKQVAAQVKQLGRATGRAHVQVVEAENRFSTANTAATRGNTRWPRLRETFGLDVTTRTEREQQVRSAQTKVRQTQRQYAFAQRKQIAMSALQTPAEWYDIATAPWKKSSAVVDALDTINVRRAGASSAVRAAEVEERRGRNRKGLR